MTGRVAVLAAVGAVALALPGQGQERPRRTATPTFGSDVEMVRLDVTVLDRGGRFVTDLRESDFELVEDGHRQGLTSFVRQELPVSLVLLLDASVSVADRIPQAQAASVRFVQSLRPKDDVRVTEFNDRVAVLQESTTDRVALEAAINRIAAHGSTALYNALFVTLKSLPSSQDAADLRRRVVVLVSDGEDTSSLVWEEQVLEVVRRREATIHVIALTREADPSNRSARLLRLLATESGGEVHYPASIRELDSVYGRISEELRSQYTIGYVSSNAVSDARWRQIALRVKGRKDLQVRHRTGYYAVPGGG